MMAAEQTVDGRSVPAAICRTPSHARDRDAPRGARTRSADWSRPETQRPRGPQVCHSPCSTRFARPSLIRSGVARDDPPNLRTLIRKDLNYHDYKMPAADGISPGGDLRA
jgi:hypothetical protein